MNEERTCPQCGQIKPVTDFYDVAAVRYQHGRRRKSICTACDNTNARRRQQATRRRERNERVPSGARDGRGRPRASAPAGWMTAREVADYLRVSRQRVHRLGQQGHLAIDRQGTLVSYCVASVTAYAQSHGGADGPPVRRGRPRATSPEGVLTVREVADSLGVSRQQVYRLGRQGHLTVVREGTAVSYRVESVTAYAHTHGGAAIRLPDERATGGEP